MTRNITKRTILAAAVTAILSTSSFASTDHDHHAVPAELLKVQPATIYQASHGLKLSAVLRQVSARSGITFKSSVDFGDEIVTKNISADSWESAVASLLPEYNYSVIREGSSIKSVIISGRTGSGADAQPTVLKDRDGTSTVSIIAEPSYKPLPAKYKDYPVGSVTQVILPVDQFFSAEEGDSVDLSLPMGNFSVAHTRTVDETDGSKTWVGHLTDEGEGYRVFLSQGKAGTMGTMTTPDGSYSIESANGNIFLIDTSKLDHTGFDGDTIITADNVLNALAMEAAGTKMDATQSEIDALQKAVDTAKVALDAANAEVKKYSDLVAKYQTDMANAQGSSTAVTTAKAALDKATADLSTAKAAQLNALAGVRAANTKKTAADQALATAQASLTSAENIYKASLTRLTTAQNSMSMANVNFQATQADLAKWTTSVKNANADMLNKGKLKDNLFNVVNQAGFALTNAKTYLADIFKTSEQLRAQLSSAQTLLSQATTPTDRSRLTSEVARLQNLYNAAVAALSTARTNLPLAQAAYDLALKNYDAAYSAFITAEKVYKAADSSYKSAIARNSTAQSAYQYAAGVYQSELKSSNLTKATLDNATISYSGVKKSWDAVKLVWDGAVAANTAADKAVATATTALSSATTAYTAAVNASKVSSTSYNTAKAAYDSANATLTQKVAAQKVAQGNYDQANKALTDAKAGGVTPTNPTGNTVIDVMMVYSKVAQTADFANQRINLLTTMSNQAYIDSKIKLTLRVVYSEATTYSESASNSQALDDLANDRQQFAGMSAKRVQYGADLVFLFRPLYAQTHGSCGTTYLEFANGQPANKWLGYGTISDGSSVDAAKGYYCAVNTYTHEIGHSLGLVHDREYSNASGVFNYSYAWGIQGSFGTIMSYKQPVVMYFSTPALATQCKSGPCGFAETDTAKSSDQSKSVNYTAPLIANFMPTVVATPIRK